MQHPTFHSDEFHVAYILSHLGGSTEWSQALLESNSPLLIDYDAFFERFPSIYEIENVEPNPRRSLHVCNKPAQHLHMPPSSQHFVRSLVTPLLRCKHNMQTRQLIRYRG